LDIDKDFEASSGLESSVVIFASDGNAFSAGHDLKELTQFENEKEQFDLFNLGGKITNLIRRNKAVFIAEVQGLATGGGLQIAAACDLINASNKAEFCLPGSKLALCALNPAFSIANDLNVKQAFEMMTLGETITAKKAMELGLVTQLSTAGDLKDEKEMKKKLRDDSIKYAEKIMAFSSQTYSYGKKAFYSHLDCQSLEEQYDYGGKAMACNFGFSDCKEGVKAFIEKRHADFKY